MRVATPNEKCIEIDGPTGRRYNFRNGFADVHPADAQAIVREGGFVPSLAGTRVGTIGYPCPCGFSSFFRRCSRCGAEN